MREMYARHIECTNCPFVVSNLRCLLGLFCSSQSDEYNHKTASGLKEEVSLSKLTEHMELKESDVLSLVCRGQRYNGYNDVTDPSDEFIRKVAEQAGLLSKKRVDSTP